MDLPLLSTGQHIRMQFDGWPAVVFSGWPDMSVGTYGGGIVAIDNPISTNGKYRILVAPDPDSDPWPDGIRVGSGGFAMAPLKDADLVRTLEKSERISA